VSVVEVQHVAQDAVDQRRVDRRRAFAVCQHGRMRGAAQLTDGLQCDAWRVVVGRADGHAHEVQDAALALAHGFGGQIRVAGFSGELQQTPRRAHAYFAERW
jgi:hypothetical protein